jgi:hypothetical protein
MQSKFPVKKLTRQSSKTPGGFALSLTSTKQCSDFVLVVVLVISLAVGPNIALGIVVIRQEKAWFMS